MKNLSLLVVGLALFVSTQSFAQSVAGAPNGGAVSTSSSSSNTVQASVYTTDVKHRVVNEDKKQVQILTKIYKDGKFVCEKNPILVVDGADFTEDCSGNSLNLKLYTSWGKTYVKVMLGTTDEDDSLLSAKYSVNWQTTKVSTYSTANSYDSRAAHAFSF